MKLFGWAGLAASTKCCWVWVFLAGTLFSSVAATHPLDHWARRETGAQYKITALTYDSVLGQYVAVDGDYFDSLTPSALLTSPDGVNWVRQLTGTNQLVTSSIASRGGQYFSAKYSTYSAPLGYLMMSTNGNEWTGDLNTTVHVKTTEVVDDKIALSGVVGGGGRPEICLDWLEQPCVADPGTLAIWISGQNGIALSVPPFDYRPDDSLYLVDADFAKGNGTWVYMAWVYWANLFPTFPSPPVSQKPMRLLSWSSRDGVNFLPGPDLQTGPVFSGPSQVGFNLGVESAPGTSVIFGDGQFVAVTGMDRVLTSYDGISWQFHLIPIGSGLQDIAYGAGQYVAVGTGGAILTSSDGVNWTQRASGEFAGTTFRDVEYGNHGFVATGFDATGANVVIQSGTIIHLQLAMSPEPTLILHGPAQSRVRIEATSNPGNPDSWASVDTVVMGTVPYQWVDSQPINGSSRFYRAALE